MALSNTQITQFLTNRFNFELKDGAKMSQILTAAAKGARQQEKVQNKSKKVFVELRKKLKDHKLELNKEAATTVKVVKAAMLVAQRAAAKAAKKAEKEAAKAEKLAVKEALKAEKLAVKAALKAEKLAAKEALKAEKLAAKAALKAEAQAIKLAEKEAIQMAKRDDKEAAKQAKLALKEEKQCAKWLETHKAELKKYKIGDNETKGTPLAALKGLLMISKQQAKQARAPAPVVSRIE